MSLLSPGKIFRTRRCFDVNKASKSTWTRYSESGKWCTPVCLHSADVGKTNVDGGFPAWTRLDCCVVKTRLHGFAKGVGQGAFCTSSMSEQCVDVDLQGGRIE